MAKVIRENSILGQRGINLIEGIVLGMGFVWRVKPEFDAGIDGEIEVRDSATGAMSGCILNVQAKARTAFQSEDAESFTFQVDADDLDYWLNGNVPTILVVCRPDMGDAYWISIRDYFADSATRKSCKVRFNKAENRFDGQAVPALVALARSKDSTADFAPRKAAEIPTPPAVQKLFDQADKLTDGDQFAEAIPVLEKALKATIKAKHAGADTALEGSFRGKRGLRRW